jgi:hypothetical protein
VITDGFWIGKWIDEWMMKEEAQDRTLWRTQFGRGYGPVARQTTT